MEELKRETLKQLGLPVIEYAPETVKVWATALFPRELEGVMQISLARRLADRLRQGIKDKLEGREVAGVVDAKAAYNDGAQGCEEVPGVEGERCYRIVVKVATDA